MTWSVTRSESLSASAKPFEDNSIIPVIKSQVNLITNYIVGKKKKRRETILLSMAHLKSKHQNKCICIPFGFCVLNAFLITSLNIKNIVSLSAPKCLCNTTE